MLSSVLHAGQRSQAERQAVNTVCQGSAADLVKLAMIQLHQKVQQQLPAESCRLLLQVGRCCMCCHSSGLCMGSLHAT